MNEQIKTQQEACCDASETEYFGARPQIDTLMQRHNFCAGFYRGYAAAIAAAPAQQPRRYTPPAQERIQALELEVRQLSEQAAVLRGALIEIVGIPTSHATVPVRGCVMQYIAKAALALADTAPAPKPSSPPQADSHPALFREAIAWGMTYGPEIPAHQWDEIRESMVKQFADRATRAPADSVLEDAARLDWLDQQCEAYGFQDIHEGNRWEISGAYANVRKAIDAARKQGGQHADT